MGWEKKGCLDDPTSPFKPLGAVEVPEGDVVDVCLLPGGPVWLGGQVNEEIVDYCCEM